MVIIPLPFFEPIPVEELIMSDETQCTMLGTPWSILFGSIALIALIAGVYLLLKAYWVYVAIAAVVFVAFNVFSFLAAKEICPMSSMKD